MTHLRRSGSARVPRVVRDSGAEGNAYLPSRPSDREYARDALCAAHRAGYHAPSEVPRVLNVRATVRAQCPWA